MLVSIVNVIFLSLQTGDPHVHVLMNDWSEISCLIHSETPSLASESSVPPNAAPKGVVR